MEKYFEDKDQSNKSWGTKIKPPIVGGLNIICPFEKYITCLKFNKNS